jgi:hypothetical protein
MDQYTKICSSCGKSKPPSEFRKGKGFTCRQCEREKALVYYYAHPLDERQKEKRKAYQRRWRTININYARTEETKEQAEHRRSLSRRWGETHRKERNVQAAVHRAVKKGLLKKPCRCSFCGREAQLYGHHIDYDEPLNVVWLCRQCHRRIHVKNASGPP